MKKIAAFFDVDGTIFRNSLLIEHYRMLIKYDFITRSTFDGNLKNKFDMWDKRIGDYDEYLDVLVDIYVDCLKHIKKSDVDFVAQRVIDLKADKMYAYARKQLDYHKKQGHLLIIISGSPSFLVEKMAKKLDADDYIATIYTLDKNENYYTGDKIPMWDSDSKIKAINYFKDKYNIDLENSYAYGDTTGDYGMFINVKYPIAINPAKKLYEKILKNDNLRKKIKIIIERKDMIYSLNADTNTMKEGL